MPSTGQPLHPTRAHCGLPSTCAVCGQWPAEPLCHDCIDRFAPAPRTAPLVPGPLSTCVAAVAYGYPWSGLLARLKFHDEPGWAGPLSMLMAQAGRHGGLLAACDAVVPVPLSHRRLAERGYNQAWELARRLQRPALPRALVRCLDGAPQHTLDRSERLSHMRGAFMVHPERAASVRGRRLLLIDDVVTTGATLQAAAAALLAAGAASVDALVLAATPAPL
jgi:ComF family protein